MIESGLSWTSQSIKHSGSMLIQSVSILAEILMDIFDLLNQVKLQPSMYVGGSDGERGEQLRNLELLLHGYSIALGYHQVQERVKDFPRAFSNYLHTRFGWSTACGPVAAVRDASETDDEAWEIFWRLVGEFQVSLETGP